MYYFVHPTTALEGVVNVPGSKSQTARGLILGTLAKGTTRVQHPMLNCDNYDNAAVCWAQMWTLPMMKSGSLPLPAWKDCISLPTC